MFRSFRGLVFIGLVSSSVAGCGLFQPLDCTGAGSPCADSGACPEASTCADAGVCHPSEGGTSDAGPEGSVVDANDGAVDSDADLDDGGPIDAGPPKIEITPDKGDLGAVVKGHIGEPVAFKVKNIYSAPVGPLLMVRSGQDAGLFELTDDTCSKVVLSPNSECTVSVRFRPTEYGERTAQLMAMVGSEFLGQADLIAHTPDLFVDLNGSDSSSGYRPDQALKTIMAAFNKLTGTNEPWTVHVGTGTFSGGPKAGGALQLPGNVRVEGTGREKTIVTLDQTTWEVPALASVSLEGIELKTLSLGQALVSKGQLSVGRSNVLCEQPQQGPSPYQGACVSAVGKGRVELYVSEVRCNAMESCVKAMSGASLSLYGAAKVIMGRGHYGVFLGDGAVFRSYEDHGTDPSNPGGSPVDPGAPSLTCSDFDMACISGQGFSDGRVPEVTCGANPAIGVEVRGGNTADPDPVLRVKVTSCDVGVRLAGKQRLMQLDVSVLDSLTTGVLIDSNADFRFSPGLDIGVTPSSPSIIKSGIPQAVGLDVRSSQIGDDSYSSRIHALYVEWNHGIQGADQSGHYPSGYTLTGPVTRKPGNNIALVDEVEIRF